MADFRVNPDGSEQVRYTMAELPVRAFSSSLSAVNGYAAACHWHDDFKMLIVPEGEIDYFVNGRSVHLKQGQGVFVNARRLHYGYSAQRRDCRYRFIVFHPGLIGGCPAVRRELECFSSDAGADCWVFDASSDAVLLFNELYRAAGSGRILLTVAKCAELVEAVREQAERRRGDAMRAEWVILRRMTGFIQSHYTERITLGQIAVAGAVCRNRCCVLFRENLGCSPVEYVTRYRLDRACAMLRRGSTVVEAALSNGFHGQSYFTEVFGRMYGRTPRRPRPARRPPTPSAGRIASTLRGEDRNED